MKKKNLLMIVALIAVIAIIMIWVLKNSVVPPTTLPTTPDQTFNNEVISLPGEEDVSLEGLNIAPDTIPSR